VVNGRVGQRGIIHNPVQVHLLPQRMFFPQYVIVHPILVKTTLQPALHRVTMKMREWEARTGMIWACRTEAGRAEMLRVHVSVECMRSPFGSQATMGLLVGCMLVMGAAVMRKFLVAPESRMAHARMTSIMILTVCSSAAEASSYFGVGVRQCCNKSVFNLCMHQLPLTVRRGSGKNSDQDWAECMQEVRAWCQDS
jgi:hypothetical protein